MKKLLTGLLALLTCFTCATAVACGDNGNKDNSNSNSNSNSESTVDGPEDNIYLTKNCPGSDGSCIEGVYERLDYDIGNSIHNCLDTCRKSDA